MKVLNLYAGIGGNRKLWNDVQVTAIEHDPKIASIYKDFFPQDEVIVTDAHAYLLNHFKEYDFIWSSPPCPSHSSIRKECGVGSGQSKPIYPDMRLYEEILLLKHYFYGKWVVENVISFYEPLIKPYEIASHYLWANFYIKVIDTGSRDHHGNIESLGKRKGFDISKYDLPDKRLALRNCVEPELGLHILHYAIKQEPDLFKLP